MTSPETNNVPRAMVVEPDRRFVICAFILATVTALILSAANITLGPLNQDEGWYLAAAQKVHEGAVPYRDFAFTQGPVMPILYAPLTPLVQRGGLAAARVITAIMGLLAAWAAAATAGRLVPPRQRKAAFVTAWILIVVNVYQSYFTAIVKTYAAASLLLTAGFALLFIFRDRPSKAALMGAAAAFAMAAGIRISLAVVGPVIWLGLCRERHTWPRAWAWFGIGGAATALLVFVPFAVAAPEGMWFGMVEYHSGRSAGSPVTAMALKAGFFSRMAQGYLVATVLGAVLLADRFCFKNVSDTAASAAIAVPPGLQRAAGVSLVLTTLIHAASPFPYDDYQTVIYAPACTLLAAAMIRRTGSGKGWYLRPAMSCLLIAATIASFASPINQEWFVSGRDRIWWRMKERSDLRTLQEAARRIRALYEECGGELLTQDTYLAVEAGCRVPVVLALGPFAYFPEMPTARARRLHVTNRELLTRLIRESTAPAAAFSGYGLAIAAPAITGLPPEESAALWNVLLERYEPYDEIPAFGQAHTTLRILRRRNEEIIGENDSDQR